MPYDKQEWVDGSAGGTPVSATRLSYMENGIGTATELGEAALAGISNLGGDTLPTTNAIEFLSASDNYAPARENLTVDPRFKLWPQGTPQAAAVSTVSVDATAFAGIWRFIAHGGQTVTARQADPWMGGAKLAMVSTGAGQYTYVRQLLSGIMQFSGGTFTLIADVETDVSCQTDFYARARYNVADTDRILIVDTPNVALPAGRRLVAVTFTVPVLDPTAYTLDFQNSLEFAFRFISTGAGTVNATIKELTILPGNGVRWPVSEDISIEQKRVEPYIESGASRVNGFDTTSGQKAVFVEFRTPKWRDLGTSNVTITDLAGNVGKITTYDASGAATHNQAYTAVGSLDSFRTGFYLAVNSSTVAGIGFSWTAWGS